MTPSQKLKMGKAVAKDIGDRYKFKQSGKPEATLYDVLMHETPSHGRGLNSFLSWSNPLFKGFNKTDVLTLLAEKGCFDEPNHETYTQRIKEKDLYEGLIKELNDAPKGKRRETEELEVEASDLLVCLDLVYSQIEEEEEKLLKGIEEKWRSGELKHALLTHAPKEKKKKTTLARGVPINQVYPEKTQKQIEDEDKPFSATDIIGLDKITAKQFQALQFLAHKAQNQTAEEIKMLKLWDEIAGETHRGFRIVAFKESEYITHSQGKESAIVSNKEKTACMNAIDEIKDITFTIRWEEKLKGKKEYLLYQHALIKTLNPKHPWTLVKEKKDRKEIKRFQFIAIPERLFEYKEIKDKDGKYKGARVLFDVVNIDPDFFTKLKYSDPEIQHVSDALMKLSLMFLIEGSFRNTEFEINEEKLLKRIGLIADNERHKARAKKTLDIYLKKLINHGTLETEETKDKKRFFKFPKKGKDTELK